MHGISKSFDKSQDQQSTWSSHSSHSHNSRLAPTRPSTNNQAMQRMLRSGALQAKLEINQPGDAYEQEADRLSVQMMSSSPSIMRRCACGGSAGPDGECASCRAKRLGVQRKEAGSKSSTPSVSLSSPLGSTGAPLPQAERAFFEPRLDQDLSHVRVHTDSGASAAATEIDAKAFTYGNHIYFGERHWAPGSDQGRQLLGHELIHVAQQTGDSPSTGSTSTGGAPAIRRKPSPSIQRQLCESPDEDVRGAAPRLLQARGDIRPEIAQMLAQTMTAEEFEQSTGVAANRLPENTFVGADRVQSLAAGGAPITGAPAVDTGVGEAAQRGLPAAAAVAAVAVPVPMSVVPQNSIGLLWVEGHLSIFAKAEGVLTVRGFRGNLGWYIGEYLPGRAGQWFTEQLLTGVPAEMRNDRLFTMMGNQSVIFRETDASTAREFANHLNEQRYPGEYRYSPPRPDAPRPTERAMYERVYRSRGATQAVMCTNNCITVPMREVQTVLGMQPAVAGREVTTGRTPSGDYNPHEHGRASRMREFMRNPDLSRGAPGLQTAATPAAARAIGYIRVGGTLMLIYGGVQTGRRLSNAWGTDEFPLVATQEALTWTGGILGSAAGGALASAIVCSPGGPISLVCAVGGFLGGLLVGAIGATIGALIVPVMLRIVGGLLEAISVLIDAFVTAGEITRGLSQGLAEGIIFRPLLTSRNSLNPCNWQLRGLSSRGQGDLMALGLYLWSKLGTADPDTFLGLIGQPISSHQIPPQLLADMGRAMSVAVQAETGWNIEFPAELIGGLTPLEFVRQLRAYRLLDFRYDPELLAEIQLLTAQSAAAQGTP